METAGLHLNPDPTAYLLCDCKQVTSLLRVSVALLATEDGHTTLRVVWGLEVLSTVPVKPSVNSGVDC